MGNIPCKCRETHHLFINKHRENTDFIIEYLGNNPLQIQTTTDCFDTRRLVFVDLHGLYRSWRRVPSILLYISLLLIPLKRKWLYQPTKIAQQLRQNNAICNFESDEFRAFMALLRWKESQGLVIWMLDESEFGEYPVHIRDHGPVSNPFVAHFWHKLSSLLMSLHDHIEDRQYDALIFDEKYWSSFCSKYNNTTKSILSELYFVTMDAKAMQEIIYQSNPNTLHPVIEYESDLYAISEEPEKEKCCDSI